MLILLMADVFCTNNAKSHSYWSLYEKDISIRPFIQINKIKSFGINDWVVYHMQFLVPKTNKPP